ncbi:TIGR03915 family putative DNA repair protein [Portibacter marinus]|uniref:TIGR03915 family putative DNA repair protein n=1 Tax=Portibacter marinus TaxID=2898660 RepID=UPI001F159854|nr:TIGR03915 family putative DNA repair protein [Portibacter marinus]
MVKEKVVCCYDGSFQGFLSSVFTIYERRLDAVDIQKCEGSGTDMFSVKLQIDSDRSKAERVLKGLKKHSDKRMIKQIYRCFLSEQDGIEMRLLVLIRQIFKGNTGYFYNYGDENVMALHKVLKMIRREVHRMHAFVRFQELKDGSYAAVVEPDFDVMPLIGQHFEDRYPSMEWIIFDVRRQYGLHYKDFKSTFIGFEEKLLTIKSSALSTEELEYQKMWRQYFQSVNISERNNAKLHLRHVPRRYWNNLIEKQ